MYDSFNLFWSTYKEWNRYQTRLKVDSSINILDPSINILDRWRLVAKPSRSNDTVEKVAVPAEAGISCVHREAILRSTLGEANALAMVPR